MVHWVRTSGSETESSLVASGIRELIEGLFLRLPRPEQAEFELDGIERNRADFRVC